MNIDKLKFKKCDTYNKNIHNYTRFKSKEL